VKVTVNGVRRDLPVGVTVAEAVADLTSLRRGVAVAVNGEVLPQAVWSGLSLTEGDRLEVLTAAQGG